MFASLSSSLSTTATTTTSLFSSTSSLSTTTHTPRASPACRSCSSFSTKRLELINKGTAFTRNERNTLGLRGLLPPAVETLERQGIRALLQFNQLPGDIEKYNFLNRLKTQNETVFYHLLINNLEQMCPIVYTPTVGKACQLFGQMFRSAEGMYFTKDDRGHIREMLDNWTNDVAIIVVTDGSRILGLGDLGANGMGIPVGKLSLYVAAGGFLPGKTLPVLIDTGTSSPKLLDDPLYLGSRHPRLPNAEYYPLWKEFLMSVRDKWPNAVVQFEDVSNDHCFDLLAEYKDKLNCFNDDIQGTGAVVAAGFMSAQGFLSFPVQEHRVLILGGGAASAGVAHQITQLIERQTGMSIDEARKLFYFVDHHGLVTEDRPGTLQQHKIPFARTDMEFDPEEHTSLTKLIEELKPTAIIGLSGQGGAFTAPILKRMGELNERPIIFSLSNPTSNSECTAEQAYIHTDGRAVFASGSPFNPVTLDDGRTLFPGQGNNMYIFPGLGFGAFLARSTITPGMVTAASAALVDITSAEDLHRGRVYPQLSEIREISAHIAAAVMEQAYVEGVSRKPRPTIPLIDHVKARMYSPGYPVYSQ
eukprot:TRINITY_DN178_c0_g6_i1.p1 TRINITY_DN178_c0_g6~~TRINITY_DN178_c0_g6_i1.p1  ORF type:complete len:588 (+),score=129.79 TRINITY_DN178_c0_g6_i1:101-1864(+)